MDFKKKQRHVKEVERHAITIIVHRRNIILAAFIVHCILQFNLDDLSTNEPKTK